MRGRTRHRCCGRWEKLSPGLSRKPKKQIMLPNKALGRDESQNHMLQKAPVGVGSIDGGTWGSALAPYEQASDSFIQTLAPDSSLDRMPNDGAVYRLGLRRRNAIA